MASLMRSLVRTSKLAGVRRLAPAQVASKRFYPADYGDLKEMYDNPSHHKGSVSLWQNLSIFLMIPGVLLCYYNAFVINDAEGHPEFVPYNHLFKRSKKFPWGDGNHSFFHGHNNALPGGYEEH